MLKIFILLRCRKHRLGIDNKDKFKSVRKKPGPLIGKNPSGRQPGGKAEKQGNQEEKYFKNRSYYRINHK